MFLSSSTRLFFDNIQGYYSWISKVFLSHAFNGNESDYIQLLKDELKSHEV